MSKVNYRSQFSYSFAGQPVVLRARVTIGASGAPTIVAQTGMGIESIVRNSAGKYTITLSNPFRNLLDVRTSINSAAAAPAAPLMNIATNAVSAATPTVAIQFRDLTGTALDPASGESIHLTIELNRSSTGY